MNKILRTYRDVQSLKPGDEIVYHTPDTEILMNFVGIVGQWDSISWLPGCEKFERIQALKPASGEITSNLVEIPLTEAGIFPGEDGHLGQNWLTSNGNTLPPDDLQQVLSQINNK